MRTFSRFVGSFLLMTAIFYAMVVLLLPPAPSAESDDVATGRSAATRLSQEASALIQQKPSRSLD